ncbi:MAG TPA: hypothetical protein VE863_07200 [Pyrinomonadaceae bacterium]|jgi:hypothetical protein|nr:hypothetical protein [Pyrinomonadaceae bacterium]
MNGNLDLEALERRTQRLERLLRISITGWIALGVIAVCAFTIRWNSQQSAVPASLRVSELVVVDAKGVERVRIGGDLPDATINGKRVPRGEKAAGVLLYDTTGQERGGYVTWESGNVGLTLDTRQWQVALFAAGLEGSALSMWHGKDAVEIRSDEDGSRVTTVHDGRLVFQQPASIKISSEGCNDYRSIKAKNSLERAMTSCERRFSESACRACLEQK